MGTSKSFSSINHSMIPNWGSLSSEMTSNCDSSTVSNDNLRDILRNYVSALGGASQAGRGGSKIGGKSSIRIAKKIGSVFSAFSNSGYDIRKTLNSIGLTDLETKSVGDIINHLIEYCSGIASTIDDNAAKEASRLLFEDLIAGAKDIDDVELLLSQNFKTHSFEEIITKYFGIYINELLSKWFYEKLIMNKKESECANLFRQIKDFIFETVDSLQKKNPLQNIDWSSADADRLIKNIQQDVLTVFE